MCTHVQPPFLFSDLQKILDSSVTLEPFPPIGACQVMSETQQSYTSRRCSTLGTNECALFQSVGFASVGTLWFGSPPLPQWFCCFLHCACFLDDELFPLTAGIRKAQQSPGWSDVVVDSVSEIPISPSSLGKVPPFHHKNHSPTFSLSVRKAPTLGLASDTSLYHPRRFCMPPSWSSPYFS